MTTQAEYDAATKVVLTILVADEGMIPPMFRGMIPQDKVVPHAQTIAHAALDAAAKVRAATPPPPEQHT